MCRKPENDDSVSNAIYKPTKSVYECGDSVVFQCKDDCYEYDEGKEIFIFRLDRIFAKVEIRDN